MPRRLSAIEIAEGALLADIAVIFQLLSTYLPVGGGFFNLLIFIVFAILVLRRDLYVGIMSMCVFFFIVGVVTGPQYLLFMIPEALGGLYLGVTMKYRLHLLPLLLVGITCGALTLYCLIFLIFFLFGLPTSNIIRSLHVAYNGSIPLVGLVATNLGLENWWKQSLYPVVASLAAWGFAHWLLLFYVALWLVLVPIVFIIYAMTNVFVRLLGYDVRPLFSRKRNRLVRGLLRMSIRRGIIGGRSRRIRQRKQVKEGAHR